MAVERYPMSEPGILAHVEVDSWPAYTRPNGSKVEAGSRATVYYVRRETDTRTGEVRERMRSADCPVAAVAELRRLPMGTPVHVDGELTVWNGGSRFGVLSVKAATQPAKAA